MTLSAANCQRKRLTGTINTYCFSAVKRNLVELVNKSEQRRRIIKNFLNMVPKTVLPLLRRPLVKGFKEKFTHACTPESQFCASVRDEGQGGVDCSTIGPRRRL